MSRVAQRKAFTILELIVVTAVLVLLVTMTLPRVLGQERRDLPHAAEQVADLLMMFAQRETLATRPVGIWHDADRNWLVLTVLDFDERRPQEPAAWRPDRTVAPVKLPLAIDPERGVTASADGQPVDIRQWPISAAPGTIRPEVEITLFADDGRSETVVLPAHAITPYRLDAYGEAAGLRVPIDLDDLGRYREDW